MKLRGAALGVLVSFVCTGCTSGCPSDSRCSFVGVPFPGFDAAVSRRVDATPRDVPAPGSCPDGGACLPLCVDLATNDAHCGECGRACPSGARCVAGACVCARTGGGGCDGGCVDQTIDPQHCGGCERACAAGARCADGVCRLRAVEPRPGVSLGASRPRFRWSGGAGRVQVCDDAACQRVRATLAGFEGRATSAEALPPGRYFWRVGHPTEEQWEAPWWFRVDRRDTARQGALSLRPDLDGDGRHDVVVVVPGASEVLVFSGGLASATPAWTIPTAVPAGDSPVRVYALGDLDADGAGELLVQDVGGAFIARGGDRGAAPVAVEPFGVGPVALPGDTTLDGLVEVAWATPLAAGVSVWRAGLAPDRWTQFATLVTAGVPRIGPALIAPGDIQGDGVGDVVTSAPGGRTLVYLGSATGFGLATIVPSPGAAAAALYPVEAAGDLDGDGRADFLVHEPNASRAVLGGDLVRVVTVSFQAARDGGRRISLAGDVDGDGRSDLLVVVPARAEARLYRGGADGPATTPVVLRGAAFGDAEAPAVALGDVDGDGCDDVALASPTRDLVHVLFGSPTSPLGRVVTLRGAPGSRFGAVVE